LPVAAGHFRAGDLQRARIFCAACQHDRVEVFLQALDRNVHAHFGAGLEGHPFGFHLHRAAVDQLLFHLEIGDAVTEQAAQTIRFFEQRHRMAGTGQLLRAGHACRAGTDHGHAAAGLFSRNLRHDPAFVPSAIDNRAFDALDRHRLVGDVQRAGCFARGGADAAGEFREVVGGMQHFQRILPIAFVNQMVPVRDDVVHRAAVMAIRDAAVHAPRSLPAQRVFCVRDHEFAIVLQPRLGIVIGAILAVEFEEAGFLAHRSIPYSAATEAAAVRSASSC
jgi:hypothetical protein